MPRGRGAGAPDLCVLLWLSQQDRFASLWGLGLIWHIEPQGFALGCLGSPRLTNRVGQKSILMNLNRDQRKQLVWMGIRSLTLPFWLAAFPIYIFFLKTTLQQSKDFLTMLFRIVLGLFGLFVLILCARFFLGLNRKVISDPGIPDWLKTATCLVPAWIVMLVGGGVSLLVSWYCFRL
jgi:hypothetical protein